MTTPPPGKDYGFTPQEEVKLAIGHAWEVGTATRHGLTYAAARSNDTLVLLDPLLIDANGLRIENHRFVTPNGVTVKSVSPEAMPGAVVEKMLDIAHASSLFGMAGDYSSPQKNVNNVRLSHRIVANGDQAEVLEITATNGEYKFAGLRYAAHPSGQSRTYMINPTALGDNEKISSFQLYQTNEQGQFAPVENNSLPPRLLEEMKHFANRHQHFGEQTKAYHERIEQRLSAAMEGSNPDGESAAAALALYQAALDEALEKRDYTAVQKLSGQIAEYKKATDALSKPAGHHARQAYEKREGLSRDEAGSATPRELESPAPPLVFKNNQADLHTVETESGTWQIFVRERKMGASSDMPMRNAAARQGNTQIILSPTRIGDDGKVQSFNLWKVDVQKPQLFSRISPDSIPENLLQALQDVANRYECHADTKPHTQPQTGHHPHIRPSHHEYVNGTTWEFSEYALPVKNEDGSYANAARPCAMAVRLNDHFQRVDDPVFLEVQKVGEGGIIENATTRYLRKPGSHAADRAIPPEVVQLMKRFAEQYQLFGAAHPAFEQQAQEQTSSILQGVKVDAGLAKIQLAAHEVAFDEASASGDNVQRNAAGEQVRSHMEAVRKLSRPTTHHERVAFERQQAQDVFRNGDTLRFTR